MDKAEKAEKGSREGGVCAVKKETRRRRAVGTVGIADRAAVSAVERRRNDPPPKGRCPSGGGRGGQPVRLSTPSKVAAVSTASLDCPS